MLLLATAVFLGLLLGSGVGLVSPASAFEPTFLKAAPRMAYGSNSTSLNWAGYAVAVQSGEVDAAYGSWIVPTLSCSSKGTTYAAFWVGIDGYNDSTVEQTGVLGECEHGSAVYSAWYEFYPASPVYANSSFVVKPGDTMNGSVVYNSASNCFTTNLTDKTEGWTYTSPCTPVSGAQRSDAEWRTERPAVAGSLTTLANFGVAYYGYGYTGVSGTNTVVINGVTRTVAQSNYFAITMVSYSGKVLASPSALTTDGTSFTVSYVSSSSTHGNSHK
ncbi:hypothetical protein B9Q09_00075 [Candidatus Marsarchaeota G2 archaeon ECH_B_SAG-C16]|uniref:Peptidase A4 n=1 Tax=Candidatus Marsarchaeota G2 archaeon ECH_B_SAG-C16 TaxID=1978163 RepID=A0A2R6BH26_9ARCH|nr:MAG: hypothetical protein B9Q09_00075 [Candidatus Marsarchaeota G2 archaeon ECH_B_SAG-C16]